MEPVIKTGKDKRIKRTLGIRKFDSVLFASALESIVSILIAMSDTAITGHIVGEKGLSAMNVVSPIISFTIFLEGLFSVGTCMLYARYLGRFEKEKAEKTFGMGLEITAPTGIIMFLAVKLSLPFYTRFLGIQGEVLQNVNLYMRFLSIKMMISPLFALSPYLAALILFITLRLPCKKKGFPVYLKDAENISVLFDGITLTPEKIVAFTEKTEAFLWEREVSSQVSLRVQITIEDGLMEVMERHPGEKVFAECCLRSEPGGVNLSIWDSGGAFNMREDDAEITSFRSFVVNSLMENIGAKKNLFVSGFNRSSFYFTLS